MKILLILMGRKRNKVKYKNPKFKPIKNSTTVQKKDSEVLEEQILKSLAHYLSHDYMFGDNLYYSAPYKIVDSYRVSNKIEIQNYSSDFVRMFYALDETGIMNCEINHSLACLKNQQIKLYEALNYLWGLPITVYDCHKGTVYRRLRKALKFIATDLGILRTI